MAGRKLIELPADAPWNLAVSVAGLGTLRHSWIHLRTWVPGQHMRTLQLVSRPLPASPSSMTSALAQIKYEVGLYERSLIARGEYR